MEKIRKLIVKYTQIILGAVIFVMIFSNFVQMITRYFINMTVVWVEDVSVLGLILAFWSWCSYGMAHGCTYGNEHS